MLPTISSLIANLLWLIQNKKSEQKALETKTTIPVVSIILEISVDSHHAPGRYTEVLLQLPYRAVEIASISLLIEVKPVTVTYLLGVNIRELRGYKRSVCAGAGSG